MRTKTNKIYLNGEERKQLEDILRKGQHTAQKTRRARVLLLLDEHQGNVKTQQEIAQLCHTTSNTVRIIARQFCERSLESLNRKQRDEPPRKPIVTGDIEARIIALCCSEPPTGHSRWTLTLTAQKLVEMNIVPAISKHTVGRVLKKRIKTPSQ